MDADVIVVGSGISGGWAAKELTERGFSVLLLERGRDVDPTSDYVTEHLAPYELPYRGFGDRHRYQRDYKVQSRMAGLSDANEHWFVNDAENPYETAPEADFAWIRGYHLGGAPSPGARFLSAEPAQLLRSGQGRPRHSVADRLR
ncbi:FAD-dependent oxidoreductase [Novosphingobium resinovorum]